MKLGRVLIIGVVVLAVAVSLWLRGGGVRVSPNGSAIASKSPEIRAKEHGASFVAADSPMKFKETSVFFLQEANSRSDSRSNPSSMRQPRVTGSRRIGVGRALTTKKEGDFVSPRWSPDGLELLFSKPGYNGLYTKGTNGGTVSMVTDKAGIGFRAKWNDSGQIETRSNDGEVQSFQPDGTPLDASQFEQDASLTGAYTKEDTVYVRTTPGEAARPITDDSDRYYGGVISPDGKYIAYNGLHTGLYIAPLDGSSEPVSLGEGYSPTWLPDSSGLVYNISQDDGHNILGSDLYMADVTGNTVSNLTSSPNISELNPSVSPDGSSVAYEVDGVIYVAPLL